MNLTLITSFLFSLFQGEKLKYLLGILLLIVSAIAFSGIKSCSSEREINKTTRKVFEQNLRTLEDKHQEETHYAYTNFDKEVALRDERLSLVLDSLNISRKNLNYYKKIALHKISTKLLVEYDTLYEFIEVSETPAKFTEKIDNCLTIQGEFTPQGLNITAKKSLEIYDINYYKRRRLLGLRWTPRIGRKEFYQTLVTNCNDTITENTKVIFEKP